jgi:hypothetical protein
MLYIGCQNQELVLVFDFMSEITFLRNVSPQPIYLTINDSSYFLSITCSFCSGFCRNIVNALKEPGVMKGESKSPGWRTPGSKGIGLFPLDISASSYLCACLTKDPANVLPCFTVNFHSVLVTPYLLIE